MERLSDAAIEIINELHTERLNYYSEYIPLIDAANRLADYEDTGLEPEEIYEARFLIAAQRDPQKLARLRELVLADQDGRLVVLPCKVGDTLFDTYFGDIREKEVVSVGFMLSKSVKHMTIHANNFRGAITEIEIDRIGKEIFYTREEAEAALAQKGGEG